MRLTYTKDSFAAYSKKRSSRFSLSQKRMAETPRRAFSVSLPFPTIKTPDIFLRKGERRFKKAFVTIFPARKGFFAANREKTRRIFLLFAKEVYGAEF